MNQAFKRIFLLGLGLIIGIHFLLISVYCLPISYKDNKLKVISYAYVYPLFHQNWCLFVPAPSAKNSIFVRYQTKTGYAAWQDILSNEIENHKKNRILGRESIYLLLSNSLIYEFVALSGVSSRAYIEMPKNKDFEVLHYEISQYLKSNFDVQKGMPCEYLLVSSNTQSTDAYYFKSLIVN